MSSDDKAVVKCLTMLCKRHDFYVFLAEMQHIETEKCDPARDSSTTEEYYHRRHYEPGYFDEEDEEVERQLEHEIVGNVTTETVLKRVVDINGHLLCRDIEVDEDDLLEADSYDDRDDHDEEYIGDLVTSHTYTNHVVMIVPNRSLSKTFGTSRTANQGWLWFHARRCEQGLPSSRGELRALVDKVASGTNHPDATIADAMELSVKYLQSDSRTILKLLLAAKGSIPETTITICRDVIKSASVDDIKNILSTTMQRSPTPIEGLSRAQNMIGMLALGNVETAALEAWTDQHYLDCALKATTLSAEDGFRLMTLSIRGSKHKIFTSRVLPIIEGHATQDSFIFPFLRGLYINQFRLGADTSEVPGWFDRLIRGACQPRTHAGQPSIFMKEIFTQLMEIVFRHSLYETFEALMCRMRRQLNGSNSAIWVFASFAAAEQELRTKALDNRYMTSCRATYRAACEHYIGTELGDTETLAHEPRCRCGICSVNLNPFLSSTSEREKKFSLNATERDHMKYVLPRDGIRADINTLETPHRLIVEKTKTCDKAAYATRCNKLQQVIHQIELHGSKELRKLLLREQYPSLLGLKVMPAPSTAATVNYSQSASFKSGSSSMPSASARSGPRPRTTPIRPIHATSLPTPPATKRPQSTAIAGTGPNKTKRRKFT